MEINRHFLYVLITIWVLSWNSHTCNGCEFFPLGEYLRFVRIPENFPVGERILSLKVQNKRNLTLESLDKGDDAKYFGLVNVNTEMVDIQLLQNLENVVNNDKNILKFRLACFPGDTEMAPNFLSISVFVEDVNNQRPKFLDGPYFLTVDELTPIGINVFRGINALDLDKPNTPNSEIKYSIIDGNEEGKFMLESGQSPGILVSRALDYDTGDREFKLVILATDRGSPPLSSNATVFITIKDNDDLPVTFKESVYTTSIQEFYPITNKSIREELKFRERIHAFDLDMSINEPVHYDIMTGNDYGFFDMDPTNGQIYLIVQLDRERLPNDQLELTVRARQTNSYAKFGTAKVVVDVGDQNDNIPEFEHMVYNISIMENLPNGFSVLQVHATDADKDENASFLYKLEDPYKAFTIDAKTGWLTVLDENKLDREDLESVELKISTVEMVPNVANNGSRQSNPATVTIGLLDANDNTPTFTPSNLFHFQVTVDADVGSVVGQVTAEDADLESNGNGKVTYEIQKSNLTAISEELPFEIDSKHGYIFLLERPLPKLHYTLLIEASDTPSNPSEKRYSLAVVQIDVVKANTHHAPEFVGSPYEFWVGTNVGIGTSVGQVKVKDLEPKHTVYDLLHSYYEGVPFAIEERTGIIAVVDALPKFKRHHYDFEAYVTDSRHTLTTNVSIHVVDPVHIVSAGSTEPIQLSVKENVAGAILTNLKKLLHASAKDTRATEFLLANYEVRDKFTIANDGALYTLKELDREEKQDYLLTIIAQNRGVIQGQGIYQIIIHVEDENDNQPRFERNDYEGRVRENSPPGTPVTLVNPVQAKDNDEGPNAQFQIELKGDGADRFRVDPSNGKIYVGNIPLDREQKSAYALELVATDTGQLSSRVPLRIIIDDTNDNPPIFERNLLLDPPELDSTEGPRDLLVTSSSQPISVEISSMEAIRIPETIQVGSKIARVLAFDRDFAENAIVFYKIISENSHEIGSNFENTADMELFNGHTEPHFNIDRTAGEISVSKPLQPNTEYILNISASDRGGLRSYTEVKVHVFDVNNFQPVFEQSGYAFEILEGSTGVVGKVLAHDRDTGPNGAISYSLKSKFGLETIPFWINKTNGEILINGELDREIQDKYFLRAIATDGGVPVLEGAVDIQLEILDRNDNRPLFYAFSSSVLGNNGDTIPVYNTSILDNIPPGSVIATVFANDSDSAANGYGLVLLHLNNHHREFYIDSKNGSIVTASKLDTDNVRQYNLSVVASDHGKPSQSSTALVLVTVEPSAPKPKRPERIFNQLVYAYQVPSRPPLPFLLTVMNVTELFRTNPTTYDIVGDRSTVSKFRVDPQTGAVLLLEAIEDNKVYEFIVRAQNSMLKPQFDARQKLNNELHLGPNEALIRVRRVPSSRPHVKVQPPQQAPPPPLLTSTHEPNPEAAEPVIITKAPPKPRLVHDNMGTGTSGGYGQGISLYGKTGHGGPSKWPEKYHNSTSVLSSFDIDEEEHQRNSNFYAGEVAVLSLSSVIFIGGLIAAIAVACVRKRRRHHRHLTRHIPILPAEVRLQKQVLPPSARISKGPTRPVLFPMALPVEPLGMVMMEESNSSDHTSDTYTDAPEVMGHIHHHGAASYALQKAGYAICPDCRKLKKPPGGGVKRPGRNDEGWRDLGPMKQIRQCGFREISLQSSHDSGIDGSDGQCNCFRNHVNSSSTFSDQHFEDSLMPEEVKSSRNPENLQHKSSVGKNNLNFSHAHKNLANPSTRAERVVIL